MATMGKMGFYLTNNKNKTIQLPVNPEEILIKAETDDTVVEVVRLGQLNILGPVKLREVTIKSILPVKPAQVNYLAKKRKYLSAQKNINWINKVFKSRKRIRLVVSTTKISFRGTISSFEYGLVNAFSDDYAFTLTLKEYKPHKAKRIKKKKKKKKVGKKGKQRSAPPKKISRGSTVIVNGPLFRDSAGNGRGVTERNAKRKINLISSGAKKPYHVATMNGGARGWVSRSSIKGA